MPVTTVPVVSKPLAIPALRATWRKSAEHKVAQWWRFSRLFVIAFVGQVGTQLVTTLISGHVDVTQIDRKFIVSILVGAAEVAWRQKHPALTASAVDATPGATIVPGELATAVPADVTTPNPPGTPLTGDIGATVIGLVGLILLAVGVILLIIAAVHSLLSVPGLILAVVGAILYAADSRTRGRPLL